MSEHRWFRKASVSETCLIRAHLTSPILALSLVTARLTSEAERSGCRNRHALLQSEIQQGLARDLHLVSLSDNFRGGSHARPCSCPDGRPFPAACKRTDDAPNGGSPNSSFRGTLALGFARDFVFSGD